MKFVDTTFLIALLRGDETTLEKAKELNEEGGAATTVINVYEATYGVYRMRDPPRRLMELERLLQSLDIFSLNYGAALMAAKISGELERKGKGIDPFESLVAAIALVNGANSLITRNVSHFNRVDGLKTETHYPNNTRSSDLHLPDRRALPHLLGAIAPDSIDQAILRKPRKPHLRRSRRFSMLIRSRKASSTSLLLLRHITPLLRALRISEFPLGVFLHLSFYESFYRLP